MHLTKNIGSSFILFVLFISFANISNAAVDNLAYLCVTPRNTETNSQSLLIAVKNTELVGFIPSEVADVVVYSDNSEVLLVGLYHVEPDAQTGGYRRGEKIATSFTVNELDGNELPCASEYQDLISPEMGATVSLPVSPNQAILIHRSVTEEGIDTNDETGSVALDTVIDTAPFLGSMAFYFPSIDENPQVSFQFIQLDSEPIDVTFPSITGDREFVLISNKDTTISISTASAPTDFVLGRGGVNYQRLNDRLMASSEAQSLFEIMEVGNFRIYPAFGVIELYEQGGFLRLEPGPSPISRTPAFLTVEEVEQGATQQIRPLNLSDIKADLFLPNNVTWLDSDSLGELVSSSGTVEIVGVNENGQLLVNRSEGDPAVVDAWLVEVVEP